MGKTTPCIAGGGLLAAIAAVLRFVGSAIRFGPFSVSLVLIPIVLGAALYGWGMGCWLGLVFGTVVLLSGDAGLFLATDPGGAIVTVLRKGIACGAAAGLCCRWLHPRYPTILLSALAAPLVNTGVVLLGRRLFFMPLIHQWAQQAGYADAGVYLMVGMVGCPCTLVIAGGFGRFVAPLCRREAVYDEDLLLRGLWKRCTANCPSADKP